MIWFTVDFTSSAPCLVHGAARNLQTLLLPQPIRCTELSLTKDVFMSTESSLKLEFLCLQSLSSGIISGLRDQFGNDHVSFSSPKAATCLSFSLHPSNYRRPLSEFGTKYLRFHFSVTCRIHIGQGLLNPTWSECFQTQPSFKVLGHHSTVSLIFHTDTSSVSD